jgi:large subunit ribosomal protein L23
MLERFVIERPILTEKSIALAQAGDFTFEVSKAASKVQIKEAIENSFKVKVIKVNLINVSGKPKRRGKKLVYTSSYRKAVVRLSKGKIDLFDLK